jgi:ketosteroid isomerase-like protein
MRRFLYGTLLAGLLLAAVAPARGAGKEEQNVRETVRKIFANWTSLDVASNDAFYASDAQLAFFDIAPMKYENWAAYKEGAGKMLSVYKDFKLNPNSDVAIHVTGKMAWVTGTWTADATTKDGKAEHMEGRFTDIFEKRASKWIVVHEHFSMPAPM